jgi:hypothetical protein
MYSYDNLEGSLYNNTCGIAAICSIVDYYGLNPFGLQRSVRGFDNRMHFNNHEFLSKMLFQFPLTMVFSLKFTKGEQILKALRHFGIRCEEAYPAAYSNGEEVKTSLVDHIKKRKRPVIALVDLKDMGLTKEDWQLHWGIIFDCGNAGVSLASWHEVYQVNWPHFMNGWHCKNLPYPNNFYHIYIY